MNKGKKLASFLLAGLLGVSSLVALAGCGKEYELSAYKGDAKDENGNMVYNTELFYSNSEQQGYPDPQVLDDTARSGYYYLFGTTGNFYTMRSKNLAEWESVGPTFKNLTDEVKRATASNLWAPEVIYDAEANGGKGLYYLFFSATPEADKSVATGKGVVNDCTLYNMYVATSEKPAGPYTIVDFTGKHSYNKTGNKQLTDMTAEDEQTDKYAWVKEDGEYYEAAFPHYYAKYCLFSPDELYKFNQRQGITHSEGMIWGSGYFGNIDPHPFVDQNGKKWLYCNISRPTGIMVIEMTDWLTPNWENAELLTIDQYYTVEEWREDRKNGTANNDVVTYEEQSCNEGPHVIYHEDKNGKGLYYLTFSVNDYSTSKYSVAMAISENPDGPFRKLREEEGGLLLCSTTTESSTVSGAGHHSFITREGISYIIYHRHNDYLTGGGARYTAMDEMQWITVKDKDGNDMDIPYTNGPTDSMQPLPYWYSGYKNIAGEAKVGMKKAADVELEYLTDGLLSVHKTANEEFMSYIGETVISETTTFVFDFETAQTLRAVLVYNSAFENRVFLNIPKIEFTLEDGSVRVIRDVKFNLEEYCEVSGDNNEIIDYVMSGAAAFAEFYDVKVKSLKITVEVPDEQDEVGISEIKILGKIGGAQ
ncbi:MAG: family 43 glycosylhydrolase [Clostridia bacterium]|nr:family 43 glycosylhydrolase [Clostridia bacterium]